MFSSKSVGGLLVLGALSFYSFKSNPVSPNGNNTKADYEVSVQANAVEGTVSPNLMGFNIVYSYEKDAQWQNGEGKIPGLLSKIGTKQMRWPGGTVVTHTHWNKLTGQGWSDSWDPEFKAAKNTDPSQFMDLDEYLAVTQKMKTDPLIGINMGSGKKYNRVQDGINEAKALMRHCLNKGVKVKYYYLDNEPYHETANYKFTAEEYAEQINLYTAEMKKIDPNIKTIVNTHPNNDAYIRTLIKLAGKNIDYVDVHNYWKFNNASFDSWKAEARMMHQGKFPYSEQRAVFKKIFNELGYPNTELVVLEWNIGPKVTGKKPTEAEAALMISEQFTQFIQSGMHMACFWPLTWPGKASWANRILLDSQKNYEANKVYNMFGLYTDILNQKLVKSTVSADRLINVAVKSQDGNTVWIYLINKNLDKSQINVALALKDFNAKGFKAVGFESSDNTEGALHVKEMKLAKKDATHFSVTMPQYSFAKITLTK